MAPGGFEGIGQLFDGRGRIRVAYRLGTRLFQHRADRFPIPDPFPHVLFLPLVHKAILQEIYPPV